MWYPRLNMRASIIFFILCSALDEMVTFRNLSRGGVEFNPRVAWLISINPLLYPLCDIILLLLAWIIDRQLIRKIDPWCLWMAAGIARLFCFALSLS